MNKDRVTTTAILPKELYDMIRKAAYLKNVSNSEIIRQCCKKQLEIELKVQGEVDETKKTETNTP